jgi:hypothetical protein
VARQAEHKDVRKKAQPKAEEEEVEVIGTRARANTHRHAQARRSTQVIDTDESEKPMDEL